jgi:HEPN domain-containing protein
MSDFDLWLEKAEDDLDAAKYMKEGKRFSQAAFLYQQIAEKALKAILVKEGEGLFQSHDCFVLAKKADAPENVKDAANILSPYYFRTRYTDADLVEMEKEEIKDIADSAEVILNG